MDSNTVVPIDPINIILNVDGFSNDGRFVRRSLFLAVEFPVEISIPRAPIVSAVIINIPGRSSSKAGKCLNDSLALLPGCRRRPSGVVLRACRPECPLHSPVPCLLLL